MLPTQTAPRQARDPFCRYRPAKKVWAEFVAWWGRNYPGQPLPANHNLPGLTGLSEWQLRRLGVHKAVSCESLEQSPKSP